MHSPSRLLHTLSELDAVLPKRFIVFAGSAVSWTGPPYVPGVDPFRRALLARMAVRPAASYREALVNAYAQSLIDGGYEWLRRTTKFEEFLWRVETHSGSAAVQRLLGDVYATTRDEYGANHAAIVELMTAGGSACLTTNFDTCLEGASGGLFDVFVFPRIPTPAEIQARSSIFKMHGDAVLQNCVSTAPGLARAARERTHDYLPALLDGETVLVLGYSGAGDIDIAPHLARARATFVWACQSDTTPDPWPGYDGYRVVMDLATPRVPLPGQTPNLLLELASSRGLAARIDGAPGASKDWEAAMTRWFATNACRVDDFIPSLFSWRVPLPVLQFHEVSGAASHHAPALAREWALVEGGVYVTAAIKLRRALWRSGLDLHERVEGLRGLGFALWRLWRREAARRVLDEAAVLAARFPPGSGRSFDVCRVYLEVCRDLLRDVTSRSRRRRLAAEWQVQARIDAMLADVTESPQGDLLARVLEADFGVLLDGKSDDGPLAALLHEARSCEYYNVAWACASSLAFVNLTRGRTELMALQEHFRRNGPKHYVRKARLSRLEASIASRPRPVRWPALFITRLACLDGPAGSLLRAAIRELDHARWRLTWRWWRVRWRPGQRAPIVHHRNL